jgi:asparagine N-glycosylation enzyme membrane subunit Stt3
LDSIWYILEATSLANSHHYSDPVLIFQGIHRPTANFPPLYPLFLAALYRLGAATTHDYQVAGACCGGATVVLTGLLGRRVGGPVVGLVAACLVAVSPVLVATDATVMSETIAVPLTVAVLLAATWAAASGSVPRWGLVGVLAGLVALARGEAIVLAMVLVPVLVVCAPGESRRRRLAQLGTVVGGAALVVAPWLIRNVEDFHPPVLLSSNLDSVLSGANCGPTYHSPMLGLWDFNCTDFPRRAVLGEARYSREIGDRALHYAADHAGRVPLVMGVRILRGWGLYDPSQQVRVEAVESRSIGWGQFAWFGSMATLVLALPGMASLRRRHFELAIVAGPAALATAVLALTWGDQRFVLTAVPTLAVAAALSVLWLCRRLPFGRRRVASRLDIS